MSDIFRMILAGLCVILAGVIVVVVIPVLVRGYREATAIQKWAKDLQSQPPRGSDPLDHHASENGNELKLSPIGGGKRNG
jgi:hypothetical protein